MHIKNNHIVITVIKAAWECKQMLRFIDHRRKFTIKLKKDRLEKKKYQLNFRSAYIKRSEPKKLK